MPEQAKELPPDARQWLTDPAGSNGSTRRRRRKRAQVAKRSEAPKTPREDKDPAQLASTLKRAKRTIKAQTAEIAKLEAKLTSLESRLGDRAPQDDDGLDLNRSTFEQFRDAGLSVTQCATLIEYRHVHGDFDSIEALDRVPQLTPRTVRLLRENLAAPSR